MNQALMYPPAQFTGTGWTIPLAPPTVQRSDNLSWRLAFSAIADWVKLPAFIVDATPGPQLHARELADWTGMSRRVLADLLGITHPTFSALLTGSATSLSKKPEAAERLAALHALSSRLATFEIDEPGSIARAFLTRLDDGRRISDLAVSGELATAYLAALELLSPSRRRPTSRRISTTRSVGSSTVALSD